MRGAEATEAVVPEAQPVDLLLLVPPNSAGPSWRLSSSQLKGESILVRCQALGGVLRVREKEGPCLHLLRTSHAGLPSHHLCKSSCICKVSIIILT